MSTEKFKNVQEVKEMYNSYVQPIHIGAKETPNLTLTPQEALWKANNLIRVCQGALFNINESFGSEKVNDLVSQSYVDMFDVIETLGLVKSLLPMVEMEFLENLPERF